MVGWNGQLFIAYRTSTREQYLDRGITEITAYCEQNQLELERIFTDQQTGKDFNRPRYQALKEDVLRSGDELIITEVDRLGRNKKETLSKLQYFRDHNIRVKILELPTTLMDISKLDNTMAQMLMETVNNMLIELYAAMAQAEIEKKRNVSVRVSKQRKPEETGMITEDRLLLKSEISRSIIRRLLTDRCVLPN